MSRTAFSRRDAVVAGIAILAMALGGTAAAHPAAPTPSSQDERACDLLSPELLFDVLDTGPDDYERSVFDEPSYWACNYAWSTEGAVSQVTFAISKVGDADPSEVYHASTQALTESGDHRQIDDLGDQAVWIPGVPQLSVRSGGDVLHLSVVHPSGDGLDASRRLAEELLARMD